MKIGNPLFNSKKIIRDYTPDLTLKKGHQVIYALSQESSTYIQVLNSYIPIAQTEFPIVQFESGSFPVLEGGFTNFKIVRSGNLSQNTVVSLYVLFNDKLRTTISANDLLNSNKYNVFFEANQSETLIDLKSILRNDLPDLPEAVVLILREHTNCLIGNVGISFLDFFSFNPLFDTSGYCQNIFDYQIDYVYNYLFQYQGYCSLTLSAVIEYIPNVLFDFCGYCNLSYTEIIEFIPDPIFNNLGFCNALYDSIILYEPDTIIYNDSGWCSNLFNFTIDYELDVIYSNKGYCEQEYNYQIQYLLYCDMAPPSYAINHTPVPQQDFVNYCGLVQPSYAINYTTVPQQDFVNYCEHPRESCVTGTGFDTTNIEIPSFLPTDSALWLDANDSSTLTLVSGAVSEWRDKSGNNRHATQSSAANRPLLVADGLNGTDVIRFDGNNDFLQVNYSINGLTGVTFFVVGKRGTIDFSVFLSTDYSHNPPRGILVAQSNTTNAFKLDGRPQGGDYLESSLSPQSTNYSIVSAQVTNTGIQVGGNGVLGNLVSYSAIPTIVSGSLLFIGSINSLLQFSSIDASQIIIFPRVLTQTQREQVEGYLAWSTGLQGNLPAGHPYKNSYPGVTVTATCTNFYNFTQSP